eukprot:3655082-Rhodomonas_salina.1
MSTYLPKQYRKPHDQYQAESGTVSWYCAEQEPQYCAGGTVPEYRCAMYGTLLREVAYRLSEYWYPRWAEPSEQGRDLERYRCIAGCARQALVAPYALSTLLSVHSSCTAPPSSVQSGCTTSLDSTEPSTPLSVLRHMPLAETLPCIVPVHQYQYHQSQYQSHASTAKSSTSRTPVPAARTW